MWTKGTETHLEEQFIRVYKNDVGIRAHKSLGPGDGRDIWIRMNENRDINRLLRAWINIYLSSSFFVFAWHLEPSVHCSMFIR